jgi:3-hydroxyacyl-[acyl-carrier-protein] dehydratase
MPPKKLVDLSQIDLNRTEQTIEDIRKYNQQRFEMEMLSGIAKFNVDEASVVAYLDVSEESFWVRGHIPGRPLMPGVLMCECAAQTCSYCYGRLAKTQHFLGFAGMDRVKFRGQVLPGDRLIMVAKVKSMKARISTFDCQGFVNGRMVFEGVIHGVAL